MKCIPTDKGSQYWLKGNTGCEQIVLNLVAHPWPLHRMHAQAGWMGDHADPEFLARAGLQVAEQGKNRGEETINGTVTAMGQAAG